MRAIPRTNVESRDSTGEQSVAIIQRWKSDPELRAEFGNSLSRYAAYESALQQGRVRIFGKRHQ